MQNKKIIGSLIAAITLLSVVTGCGTSTNENHNSTSTQTPANMNLPKSPVYTGPIVATYNGGKLTKQEFDQQYNLQVVLPGLAARESKQQFLNWYITWYKYIYPTAAASLKTPVNTSQAQQLADQSIQQLITGPYKTKQDVLNHMKSLGLTEADLVLLAERSQVLQQYLQSQMQSVSISNAQAQQYYNQHQADFMKVTVDQILVSTEAKAKEIEAKLKAGANFATLANEYSIDPSVKQNHGHFANVSPSEFVAPFAQACETLPIGQISNPVHSQYGYHIIRVDSRQQQSFSQVESQVKQQMLPTAQSSKEQSIYSQALAAAHIVLKVKPADL